MSTYVAELGRLPKLSLAELEALYSNVKLLAPNLAEFTSDERPVLARLGFSIKLAEPISDLHAFFKSLPPSTKITLGLSDFSKHTTPHTTSREALKLKRELSGLDHSVRIVPNQTAILSSATSFHNRLFSPKKFELIKLGHQYYKVFAVTNIESYARRDRERPARDARVGMLPPKLAQLLINLCGPLPVGTRLLDPFCGTGVLLQEALLDGYIPYGTDLSNRMVDYTEKNLKWLVANPHFTKPLTEQLFQNLTLDTGDATSYSWQPPVEAVAAEAYLGPPLSAPPSDIQLREIKQNCKATLLAFLKNLEPQIASGTPVVLAIPAWLRPDRSYSRLNLLDEIANLRYNVYSFVNLGQDDLLYYREGQVVAREIIILRKK